MTFLGFRIDEKTGDLMDPNGGIVSSSVMSRGLYHGLAQQGVNLNEDFGVLPKHEKILKLLRVILGTRRPSLSASDDPDHHYDLTTDNCQKILAMHVRFSSGVPVALFGETGIGKTTMVAYYAQLCAFEFAMRYGHETTPRNMRTVRVHGGTSFADVKRNVEEASAMAKENSIMHEIKTTVLFFDE